MIGVALDLVSFRENFEYLNEFFDKTPIPYSHEISRPYNFRTSSLCENSREQVHAVLNR